MNDSALIALFTDFGVNGPYIGQMKAAIYQVDARARVIDLFADAPRFDPVASGYLLAAYTRGFPVGTVFLSVVDPEVGSARRKAVVVKAGGYYFVGPNNGLFDAVICQHAESEVYEIAWTPSVLSNTFHGRDLFAPVAVRLASDSLNSDWLKPRQESTVLSVDADCYRVVYIDSFGNAICGVRSETVKGKHLLAVNGHLLERAHTFSDVVVGRGMWYENSSGLVEISVNRGNAAELLNLSVGVALVFK